MLVWSLSHDIQVKKCIAYHLATLIDGAKAGISDVDLAVKALDEEVVRDAAGEDWRSGEWEGLGEYDI